MICHNPECKREFTPERDGQLYHNVKCRNRMTKIREKARRNATDKSSITHPCRRCGGPAGYKKIYCGNCKATPKGEGIKPLNTSRIRAARAHELEMIERVVAKAQAGGGGPENMYRTNKTSWHGVKVG